MEYVAGRQHEATPHSVSGEDIAIAETHANKPSFKSQDCSLLVGVKTRRMCYFAKGKGIKTKKHYLGYLAETHAKPDKFSKYRFAKPSLTGKKASIMTKEDFFRYRGL